MSQLDRHTRQQPRQPQPQHGGAAAAAAAKSALDAPIQPAELGHVVTPSPAPLPHISALPGADDKEWDSSSPPLAACEKHTGILRAHSALDLTALSSPTAGLTALEGEVSLKSATPLSPPATSKSAYRRLSLQSLPTGRSGALRRAHASATAAVTSVRSAPTPSPSPAIPMAPRGIHSPASQLEQCHQQQQQQTSLSIPTPIDVANNSPSQQTALSSSSSCGVLSVGGPLSVGSGSLDSATSSCCSSSSHSAANRAPMSLLSLDYLSPSSSPPPTGCSSGSSIFAASQSATSRSACISRSSVGSSCLFSPPGLNERASLTEELSSDGADSSTSPDRARRSQSATTQSTSVAHPAASNCTPSPVPLALMRPGVLMGVPKSLTAATRTKRRQHLHQSQLSAALSALVATPVAPCSSRLGALSLSNDVGEMGVVASPLFPTPSPRSGCSDTTMSPSPGSGSDQSSFHYSFLTPFPSPVAESQQDELDSDTTVPASAALAAEPASTVAALIKDELQLKFLHEIIAPVAVSAGVSIGLISPPAASSKVGVAPLLLTDPTVPRRKSSAPLVVSPPQPTGSPIGVEICEEQQKHIASLVRKSRKRSTRRRSSGSKLFADASLFTGTGTTPPTTHRHSLPSTRGVDVQPACHACSAQPTPSSANCCSTHSTPVSRGSALLSAPFSSPASGMSLKSPMLSPSLTFLSSSPRNFNKFNLKLPSGSPPLTALGHRTMSDGAASSAACGATPYSSEDDFGATPDNAGLGTEEDGEIILCGIHVHGASSHSDGASTGSDTSESDSDGTPSAASAPPSMLALLPIPETVDAAGAVDAVVPTPSVVPSAVLSYPSTPHHLQSEALVPAFSSSFDTSHIDRMDGHTLRASAAQEASESSVNNTPPMRPQPVDESRPDPPAHQLPSPRAAAFRRRMARRATIANTDYSPVAIDAHKANARHSKSRSSVPYDFSPAGHLIIDGFEISKKGVARTPEVASRRLTSISCGSSPMLAPRSLLNIRRDSSPGSAGGADPVPPLMLPRKLSALSTTISDPSSLSNTPTLLGRRLSLVQQQREKEAVIANNSHNIACGSAARSLIHRRRWGSADVTPLFTPLRLMTADSAPSSARCVPDIVSGSEALTDQELKSSFGPKFKQPKAASLGIEMRLSDLVRFGEIGRGANGAVHKAVHLPTLRVVALKSVSIFDAECSHQFLQELHAFLHCDSEQMVKFVGACFSEGMITMALEYLNRGSLDHVVQQSGPLSESALKLVVQQLLMGIRDLHANSFLHRDIKPANCLINNWGVAKISDFGLLKRLVANESGTMECNRFVGTMLYLAPERIAGQSFSFPSDIYAAGLTVIYLATGALQQVPKDYWALVQGANNASAPPPSLPSDGDNATRFSDNLRDFVSRMVAKDHAARWTAAQLLEHPWFQVEEDAAAAAESAAVDPLEQWPGRQLTEPQTEELSILMDAVIQRWYPMPTGESDQSAAEFEPSAYDVSRFTHLAQQLGWDEKAVIAAFVERIQQRNAAALEQLRSSAASSTQVDTSVTDYSSNSSAEPSSVCRHSFSSADSSSLSTASSSFSHPHGSLLESTTVESDTVSCLHPPNLPLHSGSPRGLAAGAPRWSGGSSLLLSRSHSNSPCNSPTNSSKPPKAPVRPRSPSPAAEPLSAAGSLDASAADRNASRRLGASGRRLSFGTRRADMSQFATPGPSSHVSSCSSSQATGTIHFPALAPPPRALGFTSPESIASPVLPPLHNRAQTDADPFPCHSPTARPRCSM